MADDTDAKTPAEKLTYDIEQTRMTKTKNVMLRATPEDRVRVIDFLIEHGTATGVLGSYLAELKGLSEDQVRRINNYNLDRFGGKQK